MKRGVAGLAAPANVLSCIPGLPPSSRAKGDCASHYHTTDNLQKRHFQAKRTNPLSGKGFLGTVPKKPLPVDVSQNVVFTSYQPPSADMVTGKEPLASYFVKVTG